MKFKSAFHLPLSAALCGVLLMVLGSCRKKRTGVDDVPKPQTMIAPELRSNTIGSLPGAVYHTQIDSPIHWQPWTPETMNRAKAANRLVFVVIAMPQQPQFQSVLSSLAANPALIASINDNYVPVLIDGDASREIGLLTADLCAEIKRGLQLPLFVWMTPDANPIAWIPVVDSQATAVTDLFNQSHSMVSRMWTDDPSYVTKNSALDNANRRARFSTRKNAQSMSKQPATDTVRALRQLTVLYDSYSHSFDEAGGLFPSGAVTLLATAAVQPGLPDDLHARCLDTLRSLLDDLLSSAMFDPLEGGVFSSRRGVSWSLPAFIRDCSGQARTAVALCDAYQATGDERALGQALELIAFAEKNFATPDGLFAVGLKKEPKSTDWLWSVEEIEKELSPEDAVWWIKATNMKGLGNLPSEVDPQREFFRCNSIGLTESIAQLAAEQSQPVEEFKKRFELVRKKLLKIRTLRVNDSDRDIASHAGVTFRMVSAYAAAFGATGDPAYRDQAVALLTKAKAAFFDGPRLRSFAMDAPRSIGEGRAFLYGLALQSANDVAVITSDNAWLGWCEDLATTAAELFTSTEILKECPDDAKIIDLPVTDLVMLFDDSTAGLISMAECRLAEEGRPLVKSFSDFAIPLPTYAADNPILHTDLLQATLAREFKVTLLDGANLNPAMKLAFERLPMRMFQRRPAKASDAIPAGSIKIVLGNGENHIVSTPQELNDTLFHTAKKP